MAHSSKHDIAVNFRDAVTFDESAPRDSAMSQISSHSMPGASFPSAAIDLIVPHEERARYRLGRRIGRVGNVYQGLNPRFEIALAVKRIPFATALPMSVVAAFAREATTVATLEHPAIVRLLQAGQFADGTPFIAMEQLRGTSLESWLAKHGPLAAPDVLRVIRTLASALSAAHARGVIHRDVCAQNVYMQALPGREVGSARLLDFGVGRLAHAARLAGRTGVPDFPVEAAPEQKRRRDQEQDRTTHPGRDKRVDQYGLAALTYRLLTGGRRLPEDSSPSLCDVGAWPLADSTAFAPALEAVLSRGLQRRPDDRYISVQAFFEALETAFGAEITLEAAALDREDISARAIRASAVVDWGGGPDAQALTGPPPPEPTPNPTFAQTVDSDDSLRTELQAAVS